VQPVHHVVNLAFLRPWSRPNFRKGVHELIYTR
jgi:hypothetical protein